MHPNPNECYAFDFEFRDAKVVADTGAPELPFTKSTYYV